jgi:hypothetical protein
VADEGARVDVPDDGNFMAIQIKLRGFRGAPVGRNLLKLSHDQRLDIRTGRFFIIKIGADISDVRIGETNDLAGVAGVGEYFLISRKAGIENNFAAAARDRAGCTAVKYAPVFERKNRRSVLNFVQRVLL